MSEPVSVGQAMAEYVREHLVDGTCNCVDAQRWATYWTVAAVTERLAEQLDAEQKRTLERWGDAGNDVRGVARIHGKPAPSDWPTHAELQMRRMGH